MHVQLLREGWSVTHKKVHRIHNELGMRLRNKAPKRRVMAQLRDDRREATSVNETWAMDFVHDQLATGRKLRVPTVVDIFTRYAPAVDARVSYRGEDVVRTLDEVCARTGYPKTIRGRPGYRPRKGGGLAQVLQ